MSLLLQESEVESRTSVKKKISHIQVWWGLTGFYSTTLFYHVLLNNVLKFYRNVGKNLLS